MKKTITTLLTVIIAVIAVFTFSTVLGLTDTPDAFAQATCGACGDDPAPSTGGGGGGDGGGSNPNPPVCNLTVDKDFVNPGQQYTVAWNGTSG